jgi:hypothetical protein
VKAGTPLVRERLRMGIPPTPLVPLVRKKLRNLQIRYRHLTPVQGDLDALLEIYFAIPSA